VVVISEFVKDMGDSIVVNTNNGISLQIQRKTAGHLIRGRKLYDRDFNRYQEN
jgi:hypothetical protein